MRKTIKKKRKYTKRKLDLLSPIVNNMETQIDNALLSNQVASPPRLLSFNNDSISGVNEVAEQAIKLTENLRKLSLLSNRLAVTLINSNETLENLLGK